MKLVLAVIDGLHPSMTERAIADGQAPALRAIRERGFSSGRLVSAFPSVTPVCAATIATGALQDRHGITGMNWYSRAEGRYVEYGSSLRAAARFGIARQLTDTVYRMNMEHLDRATPTIYESLDDAGVRTAGTTYLMYRGRHEHRVRRQSALTHVAAGLFRRPIMGPRELFYADMYASRETPCRSQLGRPGVRDQHAGCAGAWLAERGLFDFLLLSLPDNDNHSHKLGPAAQPASIARADQQLMRVADAAGGLERFLDTHAVIVCADHSHTPVRDTITLREIYADARVAGAAARGPAEIALSPNQRAAMIYRLDPSAPPAATLARTALAHAGVELAAWRDGDRAVIARDGQRLVFSPRGPHSDRRGNPWRLHGPPLCEDEFPDAYRRVWAALAAERSGDVLLSAAPGWEFRDWGGADHAGGGSHGSLHAADSLGALMYCGLASGADPADRERRQWSLTDVAGLVRAHFGAGV